MSISEVFAPSHLLHTRLSCCWEATDRQNMFLQVYLTKQHLVVVTEFVRGGSLQQYAQHYPKERPMAEDEAQ